MWELGLAPWGISMKAVQSFKGTNLKWDHVVRTSTTNFSILYRWLRMSASILQMRKVRQKVKYKARSGNVWQNAFLTASALLIVSTFSMGKQQWWVCSCFTGIFPSSRGSKADNSFHLQKETENGDSVLPAQDLSAFLPPLTAVVVFSSTSDSNKTPSQEGIFSRTEIQWPTNFRVKAKTQEYALPLYPYQYLYFFFYKLGNKTRHPTWRDMGMP